MIESSQHDWLSFLDAVAQRPKLGAAVRTLYIQRWATTDMARHREKDAVYDIDLFKSLVLSQPEFNQQAAMWDEALEARNMDAWVPRSYPPTAHQPETYRPCTLYPSGCRLFRKRSHSH
ncbi:hypothetical protein BJX76DRAFT_186942 [Aspergillus varians]